MTVSELYNQVARLLFESSLEDDAAFLYAAQRSLLQVNDVRPAIRSCTINHKPLKNVANRTSHEPVSRSEELIVEGYGAKAYYFEADGNGQCIVEACIDGAWQMVDNVMLTGGGDFKPYRGLVKYDDNFVNTSVRLRFLGDFYYSVKSVALYCDVFSADAKDVPAYEAFTRYDISRLAEDFLALATPPIAETSLMPLMSEYDVEDGRVLMLPYEAKGCYTVRYKHRPEPVSTEDEPAESEQVIDLADDLAALLPNLVAAYMLTEDDMDRAKYHLALYQQQAAVIAAGAREHAPGKITNNGW